MFDWVKCERPLPDGWDGAGGLQTKDFDCDMVTHVITKEGRLLLERVDATHVVPKEERPHPDGEGLLGVIGMLRVETSRHESDFHGVMRFYGHDDKTGVFHEYTAKFTDGRLVEIRSIQE